MWSHSQLDLPASARAILLTLGFAGTAACTAGVGSGDVTYQRHDGGSADAIPGFIDAAVPAPDAAVAQCPADLPDTFGDLGTQTANKNAIGGSDNVYVNLQNNPRWFMAMSLWPGRGVFAGGIVPGKYEIAGDDTDFEFCSLCVNLFADVEAPNGGASQHMFPTGGSLTIKSVSADKKVSGTLDDVTWSAIKIGFDEESIPCSGTDDPCVNTNCVDDQCGRQISMLGCETVLKSMTF